MNTFKVGDKVRLKKEFYKESGFMSREKKDKQFIGKLSGKEITVSQTSCYGCCIYVDGVWISATLLELIEPERTKRTSCRDCDNYNEPCFILPCSNCIGTPTHPNFKAKEQPKQAEPIKPSTIKIGDWVQATKNCNGEVIKKDCKYQVIGTNNTGKLAYVRTQISDIYDARCCRNAKLEQPFSFLSPDQFIKCDAPATETTTVAPKPTGLNLKVGDRVTSAELGIGTVIDTHYDARYLYLVQFDRGGQYSFDKSGQYVIGNSAMNIYNIKSLLPAKRQYTPEQIAEAKEITYRLMCKVATSGNRNICYAISFGEYEGGTLCPSEHVNMGKRRILAIKSRVFQFDSGKSDPEFSAAICSDNDEWNEHVGRMVAICKLLNEPMPKWVHGK